MNWILILLFPILMTKYGFSYPANGYVLAYIPVDEFIRFISMMTEPVPAKSEDVVDEIHLEIDFEKILNEIVICNNEPYFIRRKVPFSLSHGFPIHSLSVPLTSSTLPTTSFSHAILPSPSLSLTTTLITLPNALVTEPIDEEVSADTTANEVLENINEHESSSEGACGFDTISEPNESKTDEEPCIDSKSVIEKEDSFPSESDTANNFSVENECDGMSTLNTVIGLNNDGEFNDFYKTEVVKDMAENELIIDSDESVPISGTMAFKGLLPASGGVKIFSKWL